jgi:hypothetical protein
MGIANAQRTLNYIRTLTEFISQDQYKNLVPMFGIMNEPLVGVIATESIRSLYVVISFPQDWRLTDASLNHLATLKSTK